MLYTVIYGNNIVQQQQSLHSSTRSNGKHNGRQKSKITHEPLLNLGVSLLLCTALSRTELTIDAIGGLTRGRAREQSSTTNVWECKDRFYIDVNTKLFIIFRDKTLYFFVLHATTNATVPVALARPKCVKLRRKSAAPASLGRGDSSPTARLTWERSLRLWSRRLSSFTGSKNRVCIAYLDVYGRKYTVACALFYHDVRYLVGATRAEFLRDRSPSPPSNLLPAFSSNERAGTLARRVPGGQQQCC